MNFSHKLFDGQSTFLLFFLFSRFPEHPSMARPCISRPAWFTDKIMEVVDEARQIPFDEEYLIGLMREAKDILKTQNNNGNMIVPIAVADKVSIMFAAAGITVKQNKIQAPGSLHFSFYYPAPGTTSTETVQ